MIERLVQQRRSFHHLHPRPLRPHQSRARLPPPAARAENHGPAPPPTSARVQSPPTARVACARTIAHQPVLTLETGGGRCPSDPFHPALGSADGPPATGAIGGRAGPRRPGDQAAHALSLSRVPLLSQGEARHSPPRVAHRGARHQARDCARRRARRRWRKEAGAVPPRERARRHRVLDADHGARSAATYATASARRSALPGHRRFAKPEHWRTTTAPSAAICNRR